MSFERPGDRLPRARALEAPEHLGAPASHLSDYASRELDRPRVVGMEILVGAVFALALMTLILIALGVLGLF